MRSAWLVVAALWLTGCQATTAPPLPASNPTEDAASQTRGESITVFELEVGLCLNDVDQPLAQDLTEIPAVDCDQPHQSEVFAEVPIDSGDYPGIDAVTNQAQQDCMAEFARFVGVDFAASTLNFHYYYPTASSWSAGDRSIYCVVFDPGVATEGSLQGVAR